LKLSQLIPPADLAEFMTLPETERDSVRMMLGALTRIESAPVLKIALETVAREFAGLRGWSAVTLRRKLDLWRHSEHDWRALVNESKSRPVSRRLSPEFLGYWRSLCDQNQRKCKPAHRALLRAWRNGDEIPGYGTWRDWFMREAPEKPLPIACPPDLPRGWNYKTLINYKPDKAETALTRYGVAAAREVLPKVIGTRDGLRFLEYIVLDDWRSDFRIIDQKGAVVQLNGILGLDVSTGVALGFGLRPESPKDDGQSNHGLKARDARALVADLLCKYGYPCDYKMTIICERGTATIAEPDAAAIKEATGGQVRVVYTSMVTGNVFGFADRAVGNCLGKAWIESYFNRLHNEAATLPGQIGSNYRKQPANVPAKIAEARALVKAGQYLPPELRREARLPFMHLPEARLSLEHIFRTLNNRTDHVLESFDDVLEWRYEYLDEWRPAHEMVGISDTQLDMILTQTRKESPLERMRRLSHGCDFGKLSLSVMPTLLGEHRRVSVVTGGEITFELGGRKFTWRDTAELALVEGAEFLAYYDKENADTLHLTTGAGRYVCSIPRVHGVHRGDAAALGEQIAQKQGSLNRTLSAVRRRNVPALQKRLDDMTHNEKIVDNFLALAPPVSGKTRATAKVSRGIARATSAEQHEGELAREVSETTISDADLNAATELHPNESNNDGLDDGADLMDLL